MNYIEIMKKFETTINTANEQMAEELISENAAFYTPASEKPLYGGKGYLSLVYWMRSGFSDVQWKIEDIAAVDGKAAVLWRVTATHDNEFMGVPASGAKLNATFMNFYYFNKEGKIINDVAAEGMIAILRTLGLFK